MRKYKSKYPVVILLLSLMLCSCKGETKEKTAPTDTPTFTEKPTGAATVTLTPEPTGAAVVTLTPEPTGAAVVTLTPEPTKTATVTVTPKPTPTSVLTVESIRRDYPTKDYIYGQVYEQKPIAGIPVYAVAEPKKIAMELPSEFQPGQKASVSYEIVPRNAYGKLSFSSSDENVAIVNEYGVVTALNAGEATITATAPNGVKASCSIKVNSNYAKLTFELTADGSGYAVTGCDKNALTANIPATYNGKPVKEIAGRAFIDCEKLRFFTTDPDQERFYAVDGVLYTDEPEKTLVRMPNAYINEFQPIRTYTVLPGTKVIGDYALAGYGKGNYVGLELFLPEGLTTMGNYVFTEIGSQTTVYVPDSLKTIGKDIMLNQYDNVPFMGNWSSYAASYCKKNNIPFGGYFVPDQDYSKEAGTFVPVSSSAEGYVVPKKSRIAFVEPRFYRSSEWYRFEEVDISAEQNKGKDEVRILFENVWQDRIPDKYGNKASAFPAMTGVYGMGYTEEACKLVAYAIDGKPIAMMNVEKGNFVFSFKGAANLGVVGGKGTMICAMPNEPVFVTDAGYINLKPEMWHTTDYGTGHEMIISCYEDANYSLEFPTWINVISYAISGSAGWKAGTESHFAGIVLEWNDNTRMDQSNLWHVHCDGIDKIHDSSILECYVKQTVDVSPDYGKQVEEILKVVKETMVGKYYPTDVAINKIAVYLDGSYPSCGNSTLYLDDYCADVKKSKSTYIHEMVHAIDQSIPFCDIIAPSPWMEGRAEYISRIAGVKLETAGTYYEEEGDWSFLTEQDKADFLHFYCLNNNRETPYYVGYYFIKYLNETYGDDITAKIMKAMSNAEVPYDYYNIDDETRMNMFGDIVKAATCDSVFQDFVRDVVEK